jgi:hypothetical protein
MDADYYVIIRKLHMMGIKVVTPGISFYIHGLSSVKMATYATPFPNGYFIQTFPSHKGFCFMRLVGYYQTNRGRTKGWKVKKNVPSKNEDYCLLECDSV